MDKKRKKRRNKKAFKPLEELNLKLPDRLSDYLNEKHTLLLKCIMANYTLQDIAVYSKCRRSEIMEDLIDLGKALCAYKLIECKIFPEEIPNQDYLRGWLDCKKEARRIINDKLKRR